MQGTRRGLSWTCRGHVGGGPVGILDVQGTRRGWSCWEGDGPVEKGMVLLGSWTCIPGDCPQDSWT